MNVEISKEQKEALAEKVSLCVEFLKREIQPHLTSKDNIEISMGDILDLCLTSKEIYVRSTRMFYVGIDIPVRKVLYLEKDRKTAKKYLCDVYPELAVDFLKNWDKAKEQLLRDVADKEKRVNEFNSFVDNFKL